MSELGQNTDRSGQSKLRQVHGRIPKALGTHVHWRNRTKRKDERLAWGHLRTNISQDRAVIDLGGKSKMP